MNAADFWTIFQDAEVIRNVCYNEFRSLVLGIIYISKNNYIHWSKNCFNISNKLRSLSMNRSLSIRNLILSFPSGSLFFISMLYHRNFTRENLNRGLERKIVNHDSPFSFWLVFTVLSSCLSVFKEKKDYNWNMRGLHRLEETKMMAPCVYVCWVWVCG